MCLSLEMDRPGDVLARGEHRGIEWRVIHNRHGYRCGYVKVPRGHPWHGKDWSTMPSAVDVHGGITFAEHDVPCGAGAADDAWWLGFDCAHGFDAVDPALPHGVTIAFQHCGTIRTQEYAESECRKLCDQVASLERGGH